VAPAVDRISTAGRAPRCPWLIVHGDQDELVPMDAVRAWRETWDPPPQLAVLGAADHFFHGRLVELRELVVEFAQPLITTEARQDIA